MQEKKNDKKTIDRDSSIELLKIIAIILVVVSHVIQTLREANPYISYNDYIIDLSVATTNSRNFILTLFSYFGVLGNTIFFICSSWFLLHSSKYKKQKCFFILFEVWFISIVILLMTYLIRHGNISGKVIIQSIFPTTFMNNWYLTCYLLFYPIHPILNSIIHKMNKQQLFRTSSTLFILYSCLCFIKNDLFFSSEIILWIAIYFVMAYLQLYMVSFVDNIKHNFILLFVGLIGYIGIAFLANILGLHISFLTDKVLRWITNCNPFLILISIALFNLMRKLTLKNRSINYISSLSLLIYIIHENLLLRIYYRTAIWNYIYQNYGYENLILWVFVLVTLVFTFGLICSVIYDKTLRRIIRKISDSTYFRIRKYYLKAEAILLKYH